jgi:hypothetical protein
MPSNTEIVQALVDEGFADTTEDAIAQLEDMGMDYEDLSLLWDLGGE